MLEAARAVREFRQRLGAGAAVLDCRTQQSRLAVCDPAEAERLRRQALGTIGGRRHPVCRRYQRQAARADQPRLCAEGCGKGPYRPGRPGDNRRVGFEAVRFLTLSSSPRTRGPITPLSDWEEAVNPRAKMQGRGVCVHAFAGTTGRTSRGSPNPLPLFAERPKIIRHHLEAFRSRDLLPGLGAAHIDVSDRPDPGGVIERSGANDPDVGAGVTLAANSAAAITAEPVGALHATGADPAPRFWFTAHDSKRLGGNRHRHAERAACPTLAFSEMASLHEQR